VVGVGEGEGCGVWGEREDRLDGLQVREEDGRLALDEEPVKAAGLGNMVVI
jgi:hypothetical protein